MTQAYIEGFCKAAEAYGVNPEQLVKAAQGLRQAANAATLMARAFGKIPANVSNRTASGLAQFAYKAKMPKGTLQNWLARAGKNPIIKFDKPMTFSMGPKGLSLVDNGVSYASKTPILDPDTIARLI